MRDSVKNAWETSIIKEVKSKFPQFELQPKNAGMLKFLWQVRPSLWCIISFRPLSGESFDVFCGWSTKKQLPFSKYGCPRNELFDFTRNSVVTWTLDYVPRDGASFWDFWEAPEDVLDDPELFFELYSEHYNKNLTDIEAKELVSQSIEYAINEIKDYCIPYLEKRIVFYDKSSAVG
ncbi:MAG: hypothetical protein V3U88_07335 [Methylococcales bacterium]